MTTGSALARISRGSRGGTTWASQTVPSPSGGGVLSTPACPSASGCIAVGGTGATGTLSIG